MRIVIGELETRNFTFTGAGRTREEAVAAVMSGWQKHVEDTGADPTYATADDVRTYEIGPGECLRDHDRLLVRAPAPALRAYRAEAEQRIGPKRRAMITTARSEVFMAPDSATAQAIALMWVQLGGHGRLVNVEEVG